MIKLRITYCALCCLALQLALFTSAAALTLQEAIQLAIENDAQYQADSYAAQAQYADGIAVMAGYGPRLDLAGSYHYSRDRLSPDDDAELEAESANFHERLITASFRQPIINAEMLSASMRGGKEMSIAELQEKKAREDLLLKTCERFYAALSAGENLTIAESETKALHQQVENAKDRIDLDFGTITDQYDAEARYLTSQASQIANRTEFENSKKALVEIIGQPVIELDDSSSAGLLPTIGHDLDYWQQFAAQHNTDLSIRKLQYDAARLQYHEKQSRFGPSLTFFVDYSERDSEDGLAGYGEERVETDTGVRMEMNLLAGGTDTASTVAALKRKLEARERVHAARLAVTRSVSSLWGTVNDTLSLLEAYNQAVTANEKAFAATTDSYQEGVKTLLDVLNAEQAYFRALSQYKTTRYDYLMQCQRFRHVVGQIGQGIE